MSAWLLLAVPPNPTSDTGRGTLLVRASACLRMPSAEEEPPPCRCCCCCCCCCSSAWHRCCWRFSVTASSTPPPAGAAAASCARAGASFSEPWVCTKLPSAGVGASWCPPPPGVRCEAGRLVSASGTARLISDVLVPGAASVTSDDGAWEAGPRSRRCSASAAGCRGAAAPSGRPTPASMLARTEGFREAALARWLSPSPCSATCGSAGPSTSDARSRSTLPVRAALLPVAPVLR